MVDSGGGTGRSTLKRELELVMLTTDSVAVVVSPVSVLRPNWFKVETRIGNLF